MARTATTPTRGLNLFAFLFFAFLLAGALMGLGPGAAQAQPYPNDKLGINLGSLNGRFVDYGVSSGRYRDANKDENGWPTEDFRWVAFDNRPCCWFGIPGRSGEDIDDPAAYEPQHLFGTYDFSFEGQADVSPVTEAITISELTYDEATNTTRGTVTLTDDDVPETEDTGDALMSLNFDNTKRTPSSPVGSGVTDIHLLHPGFSLDEDYPTFLPALLEGLEPFAKVRYMNWQETNPKASFDANGTAFLEWSQRKLPSDASQTGPSPRGEDRGVAYEYIIQLSNETQTDPWITVPVSASDGYIQNLAELFASELDSGLDVYVEYGNELWNPSFATQSWVSARAKEVLVGNPESILNYDGEACNNDCATEDDVVYQEATQRYAAKRTVEISQAFQEAFADDSRVKTDLAWFNLFGNNVANTEDMLAFIDANYEQEVSDLISEISVTGYYGFTGDIPEGASVDEILDELEADLPDYYGTFDALADDYGLDLAVYEGGDNTSKGGSGSTASIENRIRAARSERMGDLIRQNIVENFYAEGGDLYMYFTLKSGYNRFGTWGATDDLTILDRDFQYPALEAIAEMDPPGENERPTASFTADPQQGPAPLEVSFDATGSVDQDGSIQSYEWNFGDGETGTGELTTHTYTEDGTYTAELTVTDDGGNTDSATQEITVGGGGGVPTADIPAVASAPAIDDMVDEVWDEAAAYAIDNVIQGGVSGESDLSGEWKALWDGENLYYLVDITDEARSSDSEDAFADDSPEIYIDAENDGNSGREDAPPACQYGENDFQFAFDPATNEVSAGYCSVQTTEGIDFTVTDTENGYRLEVAIPWTTLGVEPSTGYMIGTDVHVNDDDDGGERDAKIAWSDTEDIAYAEPDVFGTATLTGESGGGDGGGGEANPFVFDDFEDGDASDYFTVNGLELTVVESTPDDGGSFAVRGSTSEGDPNFEIFGRTVVPAFDLGSKNNYINFDLASVVPGDDPVVLAVKIGEDADGDNDTDGEDDNLLKVIELPADSSGYEQLSLDLSTFTDENPDAGDGEIEEVRTVAFQFFNNAGEQATIYVDNISFSEVPVTGGDGGGSEAPTVTVSAEDAAVTAGQSFEVPLVVSDLGEGSGEASVTSYRFTLTYDASLLSATGALTEGTLSEGFLLETNLDQDGEVQVAAATESANGATLAEGDTLLVLAFEAGEAQGTSALGFTAFRLNEGSPEVETESGSVEVVALLYGDVSLDGSVTALDASLVLQALVDLIELSDAAREAGDVSGNGELTAFDATLILDYVSGAISEFPVEEDEAAVVAAVRAQDAQPSSRDNAVAGGGVLRWGEPQRMPENAAAGGTAAEGALVRVPLRLEGAPGAVRSLELVTEIDPERVSVEGVEAEHLPDGWLLFHNVSEAGKLKVAMAGAEPLVEGRVLHVKLRLRTRDAAPAGGPLSISGEARLSEAPTQALEAVTLAPASPLPEAFSLRGNAPNPFRQRTQIALDLPAAATVTVEVYDLLGRRVRTLSEEMPAGLGRTVRVEAGTLAPGVYLYRVMATPRDGGARHVETGRMVLVD